MDVAKFNSNIAELRVLAEELKIIEDTATNGEESFRSELVKSMIDGIEISKEIMEMLPNKELLKGTQGEVDNVEETKTTSLKNSKKKESMCNPDNNCTNTILCSNHE